RTTRLGRSSSYETVALPDGSERRRVTGPDGLTTEMVETPTHAKTLTYPDGSRLQLTQAPDPLLGVGVLDTTRAIFTTPAGRGVRSDIAVAYQGGSAADPSSVQGITVQSRLNFVRTSTTHYDAATRTVTATSPAGRQAQMIVDAKGRPTTVLAPGVLPVTYT